MDAIKVEFIENGEIDQRYGWRVTQGDRSADSLTWDEMLGVFVSLSLISNKPHQFPGLQWMKTDNQRAVEEKFRQERLERIAAEKQTKE